MKTMLSILVGKLPAERQQLAYRLGLGLAMVMRILLLFSISWIMGLTKPLFTVLGHVVSGRDLVLVIGGLFLVAKATHEIHHKLEGVEGEQSAAVKASFSSVLIQIAILDIVFSLDSVITAVGMVREVGVMVTAVILAVIVMMLFAQPIGDFVQRHPTMKILALAFLILIGVMLVAEGMGQHVDKGYIYFAMAFSLVVELLNMRLRRRVTPVHLRGPS